MFYSIYCGRSIPATDKTVSDLQLNKFLTEQTILKYWTATLTFGGWVDQATQKAIIEDGVKIEYHTDNIEDEPLILEFAELYKNTFNQDSVLVVKDSKDLIWI
jgi:predicted transcriptional regulator